MKESKHYCGLDFHKNFSQICVVDEFGNIKDEVNMKSSNLVKYLSNKKHYHIGIEAINSHYEGLFGRRLGERGAHCKQMGMNQKSIGICFVGNLDEMDVPDEQWHKGVRVVASLCNVLSIPVERIYGHREFDDYKSCPGERFNLDHFKLDVEKEMRNGF